MASKTPEAETAAAASAALVASLVGFLGMACQSADHRIALGSEQYGQVVLAQVGDILAVKPAPPGPGWAVEFDHGILAALGSFEFRTRIAVRSRTSGGAP